MNLYVLLKQTFDTEEKIVLQDGMIREDGAKFIVNPYDEYALEEAIRIREASGGTVYAVSVGPERAAEALRTALAMGADEAVWIDDRHIADEYGVSRALAAYLGGRQVDLVLAGLFSVDNGAGQVAIRVAELLRDHRQRHAAHRQQRAVGVAKYVERDGRADLRALTRLRERALLMRLAPRFTVRPFKHQLMPGTPGGRIREELASFLGQDNMTGLAALALADCECACIRVKVSRA